MKNLVKETPQNGAGKSMPIKKVSTSKNATVSKPKEEVTDSKAFEEQLKKAKEDETRAQNEAKKSKEEAQKLAKELEKRKPLNIADALVKISEAKALAEKMEFLQNTRKNLSSFTLGSSGMTASLELKDDSGRAFKSSNSDTVKLVLSMLKSELDKMIQEAEKELLAAA